MDDMGPDATGALRDAGIAGAWALAALPEALWLVDLEGRTLYVNEQMVSLLGRDPAELAQWCPDDVLDEVALAQVSRRPVLDDAGQLRGWLHHSSPSPTPAAASARPTLGTRPIDGVGIFDWDVDSDRLAWSDGLHRILGIRADTIVPTYQGFLTLLPRSDREAMQAGVESALTGTGTVSVDIRVLPDQGELRWLRLMLQAERDADGRPVRVRGIVQDITESKEAEQTLTFLSWMGRAANEARTLQDVLAVAERKLRPYAKWWPVLISIPCGLDDELTHLDLDLLPATDAERRTARLLAERIGRERRIATVAGPAGTMLVGGAVTVGERLACVLVDETGQVAEPPAVDLLVFEQVLGMLARVAEREWAAQDLAQARDEALRASLAKTEFLATMSHEIRTPLNGVIGLTELLANTDIDEHQRRLTRGLDLAGRTLLGLVDDVLDLSKIEAGRLELEQTGFDPGGVVEAGVSLVAERARQKGLEIAVTVAADLPSLLCGDPFRLAQVITNLTANAVKFTAHGQVEVSARVDASLPGPGLRVEVRDTGIGISPDIRAKLFQPFSQADTSTTRQYGGTGLGLAISQRIVSAMGGDIGVESEAGVGSTFWFTAAFEPPEHSVSAEAPALAGRRVLVVHRNPTVRAALVAQLTAAGADSCGVDADPGQLAGALRVDAPYDVVLLDHVPGSHDGLELARGLRDDRRQDGARLVLVTAATPSQDELRAAGVDRVLGKPVLPSLLQEAVAPEAASSTSLDPGRGGAGATPLAPRLGRVLVVEDNPVNQLVAQGLLDQLGYEVVMAGDGAAAVAAVTREPDGFDAVLMDCQMPVLDGYDATRAIRNLPAGRAHLPIIAMTAGVVEHERELCLAAGMDDFVAKPVIPEALSATLARWVSATRPGPLASAPTPTDDPSAAEPPEGAASDAVDVHEFDRSRLDLLLDGGEESRALVLRILERFTGNAAETAAGLRAAVGRHDLAEVSQLAHRLRGGAANIGLVRVAALCGDLESAADEGRPPGHEALLDLERSVARGVECLQGYARSVG